MDLQAVVDKAILDILDGKAIELFTKTSTVYSQLYMPTFSGIEHWDAYNEDTDQHDSMGEVEDVDPEFHSRVVELQKELQRNQRVLQLVYGPRVFLIFTRDGAAIELP